MDLSLSASLWTANFFRWCRKRGEGEGADKDNKDAKKAEADTFTRASLIGNSLLIIAFAFAVGAVGTAFLPPEPEGKADKNASSAAFPLADVVVLMNILLEGLALLPQMAVLQGLKALPTGIPETLDKDNNSALSRLPAGLRLHSWVLTLLALSRFLRLAFWAVLLTEYTARGAGHHLWTFVLPDLAHTAIAADYLRLWIKKTTPPR